MVQWGVVREEGKKKIGKVVVPSPAAQEIDFHRRNKIGYPFRTASYRGDYLAAIRPSKLL